MSEGYAAAGFRNTSETPEFHLHFSTGKRSGHSLPLARASTVCLALVAELRANSLDERRVLLVEDDASRNRHANLGSGIRGARNGQFRSDARRAFAHAPQTEMTVLALTCDRRIDADPVVGDTDLQVTRVGEADLQPAATGVRAGIANGLIPDPVDLVTNHRVHLPGLARHRQ